MTASATGNLSVDVPMDMPMDVPLDVLGGMTAARSAVSVNGPPRHHPWAPAFLSGLLFRRCFDTRQTKKQTRNAGREKGPAGNATGPDIRFRDPLTRRA
jgi:hypothetical protein